MSNIEKANCQFVVCTPPDGKISIQMNFFRQDISALAGRSVSLELLSGVSLKDAKRLADSMNEWILGVCVAEP
jgi:hypothetical protein